MPVAAPSPSGILTPTPAAAPTANLGAEAHAAAQVKQALMMLETALPQLGLENPLHGAVRTSINALAKHLPAASDQGQQMQQSMLRDLALRAQQSNPMVAAMQARGAPGAPPPGMPGHPPGA